MNQISLDLVISGSIVVIMPKALQTGVPTVRRGRSPGTQTQYRTVVAAMTQRLVSGAWPQGLILPSRGQLAREFNVSEMTIRLALRSLESEGLLLKTARRTLRVLNIGTAPYTRRYLVVLVLAHDLLLHWQEPDLTSIHRGIECAVARLWQPLLIVHGNRKILRTGIPSDLLDEPIKGVLLAGPFQKMALRQYERLNVPVVLVDRPPENWKLSSVCVDNVKASADAVSRLVALGHRRIAFVRRIHLQMSEVDADSKERQQGFLQGCAKHGLKRPQEQVYSVYTNDTPSSPGVKAIMQAAPPYTAVVAVDIVAANCIATAAQSAGQSIPKDLSIVCFQGRMASPYFTGPSTDFYEMGARAVELLGFPLRPLQHARIETLWEPGQTMGPPPAVGRRK